MKLSLPILAAVVAASHPASAAPRNDLSFVTANMLDFNDLSPEGNWQTRYGNLARQIAMSGAPPDIISINEVGGWQSCFLGFGPSAGDYDGFDQIIYNLQLQTGVQYRIAFFVGGNGSFGGIGKTRCNKFSGSAVLYNPTRIMNRTPIDAIGRTVAPHDTAVLGFGLRRSMPVCSRGTNLEPIASLIDGSLTTEKCSTPTPSGPAWTWAVQPAGKDIRIAAALGRFSFVSEPTTSFDVVTIHTYIGDESAEATPINDFITATSLLPFRTMPRTIPTVVTGDYNTLASDKTWLNPSGISFLFNLDDMAISQGNPPGSGTASYDMMFTGTVAHLPADDTTCNSKPVDGISDHCALRTDFNFVGGAPTPPPLPPFEVVTFPQRLTSITGNWAPAGDWIGECDAHSAVTGLSIYNDGYNDLNRMVCRADTPSSTFPHQSCHAVSIDLGQNRGTTVTGDWDPNYYKGECGVSEYVAGVSELNGRPDQLLCCPGAVAHASCNAIVIRSDHRETTDSFDWDPWNPKAECGYGRYVAGVSRDPSDRTAHSILCCNEDGPEEPPPPSCKGGIHNPSCDN
jgi:hypothetical protein